jgi:hypothetical protein
MTEHGTRRDRGLRTFSVVASVALVGVGLVLAWSNKLPGIPAQGQLMPFISTLVGVTFYVLYNVRKRRDRFDTKYLPDYVFRAAQAVVYVYAILAIFNFTLAAGDDQALLRWPTNLIGLFVGMYILHLERAIEGLGYRFEEILTAVLGRSLALPTRRETDIRLVQAEGRFREIQNQAELLVADAGPPALVEGFKKRFRCVSDAIRERDYDSVVKEVTELSLDFERTKQEVRRQARTVSRVLGMVDAASPGPLPKLRLPKRARGAPAPPGDDTGAESSESNASARKAGSQGGKQSR